MIDRLSEQPLKQALIHKGKFLEFHEDQVRLPNGKTATREYLHHPGAVAAVPILDDGRIVLVKQFRYPLGRTLLEIPAGKLDEGEDPLDCVQRELMEEIGYAPRSVTHLGSIWTTPGFTDEVIHLYLAKDLRPLRLEPDSDEFLETVILTKAELLLWMDNEPVIDSKTALAVSLISRHGLW